MEEKRPPYTHGPNRCSILASDVGIPSFSATLVPNTVECFAQPFHLIPSHIIYPNPLFISYLHKITPLQLTTRPTHQPEPKKLTLPLP